MHTDAGNWARGWKGQGTWIVRAAIGVVFLAGFLQQAPTAHAAGVVAGEATAVQGQAQVALPLTLSVASGEQVSALMLDVQFDPLAAQWQAVNLDPVISSLGKQVDARLVDPGHLRLVIYGQDRRTLPSGVLGSLVLQIPSSAAAGSSLIDLLSGEGSDPNGLEFPVSVSDGRLWIDAPADLTLPLLTVTAPSAGAHVLEGVDVTVQGTATDDQPGVTLTIDGMAVPVASNGGFSFALSGLPVGDHTIVAQAIDAAGNTANQSRTITVDAASATATVFDAIAATARSSGWQVINTTELVSWNANQWVDYQVDFGPGGAWTLGVTAINKDSSASPGLPAGYAFNFAVTLDGVSVGSLSVPGSSTGYQLGTYVVTVPSGRHTVRFLWTNDAWLSGVYDANARIARVSFTPPGGSPPAPPADTTSPVISGVTVGNVTASGASLAWTTDEPATSRVEYGTGTAYGSSTTLNTTLVTAHSATLGGLSAGTTYHARARSIDAAGNEAVGADVTFTTAASTTINGPVVTIKQPVNGSTVTGSTQTLLFSVSGAKLGINQSHVHIILDNGATWHVYGTDPFYLKNLKAGSHRLTIQLVDKYHKPVAGSGTFAATVFTVQ